MMTKLGFGALIAIGAALISMGEEPADTGPCDALAAVEAAVDATKDRMREVGSFKRLGDVRVTDENPVGCRFEAMFEFQSRNGFGGMNRGVAMVDVIAPRGSAPKVTRVGILD